MVPVDQLPDLSILNLNPLIGCMPPVKKQRMMLPANFMGASPETLTPPGVDELDPDLIDPGPIGTDWHR